MPSNNDFLPSREAELVTWSNNANALLSADPAAYGLDIGQAAQYTTLHTAFVTAYQTANDPSTRTPSAIVAKDQAKEALVDYARQLARIIQADPDVTDQQKSDLGLTVRDDEPTPVPVPGMAPGMSIESVLGRRVKVRLRDVENPDNRGKPVGVSGANIFIFTGEDAPADPLEWSFYGNVTRTLFDVDFPATIAEGAKVWLAAAWYNTRGQAGPASAPVTTNIAGGMAEAA